MAMFCPGCGKDFAPDRNFCSYCGMNLQLIKQILDNKLSLQKDEIPPLEKKRRKCRGIGFITMGLGIIYAIIIAAVSEALRAINPEIGRFLINFMPLTMIFFTLGIMTLIFGRIMYKEDKKNKSKDQKIAYTPIAPVASASWREPSPFSTGEQKALSPPLPQNEYYKYPPISVTENTTAQLKVPEPIPVKQKDE